MTNVTRLSVDPERLTTALAYDMASKLISVEEILKKYAIAKDELKLIVATREFKTLYREAKLAWDSDARTRVRAKATAAVEDGLLPVHTLLHDSQVTPQARLEAFKQLTGLADLGPKKDNREAGGRVSITINVPHHKVPTLIEGEVLGDSTDI